MFPNGNTAIDGRVTASALTASETISSRRGTSAETETERERLPRGDVVRNKPNRLGIASGAVTA